VDESVNFEIEILLPIVGDQQISSAVKVKGADGSSITLPGSSCHAIKRKISFKRNGYYWVKNECNDKPYRIFCDFDNFNSFYYVGVTAEKAVLDNNADTYKKIKEHCAKFGMTANEFNSKVEIESAIRYLKDTKIHWSP